MNLPQLWYLATIAFFIGLASYLLWAQRGRILRKHWKFIALFTIFSVPFAYWDAVAQRWHAYQYSPDHTLYIKVFGGELETYIFMGLVAMIVCSATVFYMREEQKGKLKLRYHSRTKRRQKSKTRKFYPAAGATRR
jgi:hypothetical protein